MALETETEVGELRRVQDGNGDKVPPANEVVQRAIRDQGSNHPTVIDEQHTVNEAGVAESLPDQPIPDGVEVAITYDPSNSGVVYVGGGDPSVPLTDVGQGVEMRVENLNALSIRAPNVGDGVRYLVEVDN